MILSVTRPLNARIPFHLDTEDAVKLVSQINPEIAIITHFGYKMLRENTVEKQADWIWKETGIKTIAAKDSMRISMEKEIEIKE
jgi:phosphoribosyl 1,2-cyclic phosphodiesterase